MISEQNVYIKLEPATAESFGPFLKRILSYLEDALIDFAKEIQKDYLISPLDPSHFYINKETIPTPTPFFFVFFYALQKMRDDLMKIYLQKVIL